MTIILKILAELSKYFLSVEIRIWKSRSHDITVITKCHFIIIVSLRIQQRQQYGQGGSSFFRYIIITLSHTYVYQNLNTRKIFYTLQNMLLRFNASRLRDETAQRVTTKRRASENVSEASTAERWRRHRRNDDDDNESILLRVHSEWTFAMSQKSSHSFSSSLFFSRSPSLSFLCSLIRLITSLALFARSPPWADDIVGNGSLIILRFSKKKSC